MDKVSLTFTVAWADRGFQPDISERLPKTQAIQNWQRKIQWDNREFDIRFIYAFTWDLSENHDSLEVPLNLFALAGISSVWRQLLTEIEADHHATTDENLPGTGFSLYKRSDKPSSLLAILLGNPDVKLESIPESLIKVEVNDAHHVTPLFLAVAMQREDLVRAFISKGARGDEVCDDNSEEEEGESSVLSIFELAILIDNIGIMRQLIDAYGKGPEPTPNDASTLHFAIKNGSDAVFDMLVDQCSSRYTAEEFTNFCEDGYSQTLLQTALLHENMTRCRKLVDVGADIENSADGRPLLPWCIDEEDADAEMLEFLLECGADPNRGPPEWPTPLMSAISWLWIDAIQVLLKNRRTDPNIADKEGLTGLMRLLLREPDDDDWDRREAVNITQLCSLSGRFDVEIKDPKGETVLAKAVTAMRPQIVDVLLTDGKADPNTRSACGWTPLMRSAFLGHWTITKLLLSRTIIDIEAQDSWGKTALYYAIIKGKVAWANLILDHEQTDLQSLKAPLGSACFEAAEQGEKEFLAHLPDVRPMWFGHYLISEIYNRARRGNRRCMIRQLEEAGFRPQEDIVMTDAS